MLLSDDDCVRIPSNTSIVENRTSSMFIARLNYNCTLAQLSELRVFIDEVEHDDCMINVSTSDGLCNSEVTVTCDNIENKAGKNLAFSITSTNNLSINLINETFIITLAPLFLNGYQSINITTAEDPTSALIFIPNCTEICNLEDLYFRCGNFDESNQILSDNCTYTCSDLIPGSIYNFSLYRKPILIVDKENNEDDKYFPEETLDIRHMTSNNKKLFVFFLI